LDRSVGRIRSFRRCCCAVKQSSKQMHANDQVVSHASMLECFGGSTIA
jgi:hypothetical protein